MPHCEEALCDTYDDDSKMARLEILSAGSALSIKLKIRPGGTECLHESIGPEHFTSGSGVSRSQDVCVAV